MEKEIEKLRAMINEIADQEDDKRYWYDKGMTVILAKQPHIPSDLEELVLGFLKEQIFNPKS